MDKATPDSVMALATDLWHADGGEPFRIKRNELRAEVDRLAAQAAPTEPTDYKALGLSLLAKAQAQVFDSDAASNEAFDNTFHKIAADVSRDRWNKIWRMAAQWQRYYTIRNRGAQSPAQAPVVQAVQAVELIEQEMAMLIRRLCSTTANDKTRAQAMEYLFKRGHASPLRAESAPAQAMDHPPLPEGVKARFKCEDCDGTGYTGEMIPGSEFQPPEPVGCTSCRSTGWWAECEAYSADQMHAYLDADRASSGAAQAVRVLTREELNDVALSEKVGWGPGEYVEAVQRKFAEVNGLRIPADGKIGSAA